jgi:hypothetical protein
MRLASPTLNDRGLTAPVIPDEFLGAPVVQDLYSFCLGECIPGGLYAEFGVYHGRSLKKIRDRLNSQIPLYGFDSFKGLPEEWNGFPAGSFATSVRVNLPNTHLVVGAFETTVPWFVSEHPQHVSFMHIDCDLYSSTKTVLTHFAKQIVPGTVILFDEIFGYSGYETHEYQAFGEFLSETGKRFEAIARWDCYRAAVRITA